MSEPSAQPTASSPKDVFVAELRQRVPFDSVDREHLDWIAERLRPRAYAPGAEILRAGVAPDRFHFIRSGCVRVEAMGELDADSRTLAELVEGECFPLEALHERRPIFSTFRAARETLCYELADAEFAELRDRSAAFRGFCEQRSRSFLENSRRIYEAHFAREPGLASQVSLLMAPPRVTCAPGARLRDALAAMSAAGASSTIVISPRRAPLGVFALEDLLQRIAAGADLDAPMSACMRPVPAVVGPEELASEAAYAMARHGCEEVLVVDGGKLVGTVSERQLFELQRVALGALAGTVRRAGDVAVLARAAQDVQLLAYNLMAQGVAAGQLTRLVSTLNDRITERVVELEVSRAKLDGIDFCWLAFGSEGRMEQTLWTDQDNGIVFDPAGGDPAEIREALLPVAARINDALAACGFPRCKGNVMASNPECCSSVEDWGGKFERWMQTPGPEELLKASIYFDLRPLWGNRALARALSQLLVDAAPRRSRFLTLLTQNALQRAAPIGFFRDFVVDGEGDDAGTLDLKLRGIALFVDAARVLALGNGVAAPATERRLREAGDRLQLPAAEVEGWVEAFHFVQVLRLRHQHERVRSGRTPGNRLDPHRLNPLDRRFLLEALRQATRLQKRVSSWTSVAGAAA
jgi:CBS domain-containing protein